jgi:hypothetical protein
VRFDDYLMRAIEQLTQAIAHILRLSKAGMNDEAESELSDAYGKLLGNDRVFLDMVDSNTLANLLGSPDKVRVLAKLSALDAQLAERRGDGTRSALLRARAEQLRAIAQRDDPQPGDDTLLDELS